MNLKTFIFSPGWYLLYTRPKQEKKVMKQLQEKNIDGFLPEAVKMTGDRLHKKIFNTILFPSYAFVRPSTLREFLTAGDVNGVVNYVRVGKIPARVDENTISNIRLIVKGANSFDVTCEKFEVGRRYLIEGGPLGGLICEVVQHNGAKKALVRVLLLERNVLLDLKSTKLVSAENFQGIKTIN